MQHFCCSKSEYDFFYFFQGLGETSKFGHTFFQLHKYCSNLKSLKAFNNYKWNVSSNCKRCEVSFATIQGKLSQLPRRHLLKKLYRIETMIVAEIGYPSHRVDYTLEGNKNIPYSMTKNLSFLCID
jgi:hypothetical protein